MIDNGNHLLVSGNRSALAYLDAIGASDGLIGPADASFPFLDLATGERWVVRPNRGRVPFWILLPSRRVPGTRLRAYLAAWRLGAPTGGRPWPTAWTEGCAVAALLGAARDGGAQHAADQAPPSCSGRRCGRASRKAPPAAGR